MPAGRQGVIEYQDVILFGIIIVGVVSIGVYLALDHNITRRQLDAADARIAGLLILLDGSVEARALYHPDSDPLPQAAATAAMTTERRLNLVPAADGQVGERRRRRRRPFRPLTFGNREKLA